MRFQTQSFEFTKTKLRRLNNSYVFKLWCKKIYSAGTTKILVTIILLISLALAPLSNQVIGATLTMLQTDWSGGADGGTYPVHPTNQTGWIKYDSKDTTVTIGSGNITLNTSPGSSIQTTDADFNGGTKTNVTVANNNVILSNSSVTYSRTSATPATKPSRRQGQSGVWDLVNNVMYAFGGSNSVGTLQNDLWSYNPATDTWTQLSPTGGPPSARQYHIAVWDSQNNKMWMFGGSTSGGNVNDLWSYTPSTNTWAQATGITGGPPAVRLQFAGVWDTQNNKMWIFGGTGAAQYNDLWSYTPSTNTWAQATGITGGPPSARNYHMAAWDSSNNKMWMFGGYATGYKNDLWSYTPSTNTWTEATGITGGPPEARNAGVTVWDTIGAKMYLHAGYGTTSGALSDTWSYTPSTNTWAALTVTGTAESGRHSPAGAWDSVNRKMVVFSGWPHDDDAAYEISVNPVYDSSGDLVSSAIDLGQNFDLTTISWNGSTPTNTVLKFQIRTASTSGGLSSATWYGPTGTGDYYTSSGTAINDANNGFRWVQYKAYFSNTDTSVTPTLNDITIGYANLSGTLTGSAYNTADSANILSKIQWSESLPANTDLRFQVRTAPDSSGSPGTFTSWMGPDGTSGTYFTDPTGGEAMPSALTTGANDQWIQYKAFLSTTDASTPTLSDVTMTYVVNATPVVSNTSASQGTNGAVTIGYDLADTDNATVRVGVGIDLGTTLNGTITSGASSLVVSSATYLPASGTIYIDNEEISYASKTGTTLNSLTRGVNSSTASAHTNGVSIFIKGTTVSGSAGSGIAVGTAKSISWTIGTDITGISTSTAQVKIVANDGNAANQIGSATVSNVAIDTAAPAIPQYSTRAIPTSGSNMVVSWVTNESSDSVVDYGSSNSYGSTATNSDLVTNHSISISSLASSATYYYRVKSTDNRGNLVTDDNSGASYTITMPQTIVAGATSSADTSPPLISNIDVSQITGSSFKASWATSELASGWIIYGRTTDYGSIIGSPEIFGLTNSITINGLSASSVYNFQIVAMDKSGNKATSTNQIVNTGVGGTSGSSSGTSDETQDQINNLQQQINTLQNQKTSLQVQITDIQNQISALPADDPNLPTLQAQLDLLEIEYHQVNTTLTEAEADLVALQSSASGNIENQVNNLLSEQEASQQKITELEQKLAGGITGEEAFRITSEIANLREQFVSITGRLAQAEQALQQVRNLEKKISSLQSSLDYITDKILGIKQGESLSPADLLKVVSAKFQQLAVMFKNRATVAERAVLETTLGETVTTLRDLAELVPGPKIITAPNIQVGSTGAVISWTTDKPATGLVVYSEESLFQGSTYLNQAGDPTMSTISHSVEITGLIPTTVYHYQIVSQSDSGAKTTSQDFVFQTKVEAPTISNTKTYKVNDTTVDVSWETNIPSNSVVVYTPVVGGAPDNTNSKSQGVPEYTKNHLVKITGLKSGTIYNISVSSTDSFNNVVNQKLGTLTTGQDTLAPEITELRPTISIIPSTDKVTIQVIITWKTGEAATTQVVYGKGSVTGNKFAGATEFNGEFTYNHTAVITNWDSGSLYSFKAISKDQSNNEASSKVYTIRTPEQKGTVVDVIIGNFTDVFGWTKNLSR